MEAADERKIDKNKVKEKRRDEEAEQRDDDSQAEDE